MPHGKISPKTYKDKSSQTWGGNTDKGPPGQMPAEYINTKQAASNESKPWPGEKAVNVKLKLKQWYDQCPQ